jgi:hypothetical protein
MERRRRKIDEIGFYKPNYHRYRYKISDRTHFVNNKIRPIVIRFCIKLFLLLLLLSHLQCPFLKNAFEFFLLDTLS